MNGGRREAGRPRAGAPWHPPGMHRDLAHPAPSLGWIFAVAASALTCSPAAAPDGPIAEAGAAEAFAAAACQDARDRGCVPDDCEAAVQQQFARAQQAAAGLGRTYDAACLQAHVDVLASDQYFTETFGCAIYPGPAGPGEPCQVEGPFGAFSSCAAALSCSPSVGVCIPEDCGGHRDANAGEPCLDAAGCIIGGCDLGASDDLFCDYTAVSPVCAAQARLGEACSVDLGCADAGRCDADGLCAPRLAAGAGCSRGSECVSNICSEGACEASADDPLRCD